jgi:uncharacterized protein YqjF (DUF2071 family)
LPYYNAEITLEQSNSTISYSLKRTDGRLQTSKLPGTLEFRFPRQRSSLEFFLTERYCLFSEHKEISREVTINRGHCNRQLSMAFLDDQVSTYPNRDVLAEAIAVDIWTSKAMPSTLDAGAVPATVKVGLLE